MSSSRRGIIGPVRAEVEAPDLPADAKASGTFPEEKNGGVRPRRRVLFTSESRISRRSHADPERHRGIGEPFDAPVMSASTGSATCTTARSHGQSSLPSAFETKPSLVLSDATISRMRCFTSAALPCRSAAASVERYACHTSMAVIS